MGEREGREAWTGEEERDVIKQSQTTELAQRGPTPPRKAGKGNIVSGATGSV